MASIHHFILATYQDIIKVDHHELANEWFEYLVHQMHESAGCISEAEWHHKPFIQASCGLKGCFPFIPFIDSNLILATSKINLREDRLYEVHQEGPSILIWDSVT